MGGFIGSHLSRKLMNDGHIIVRITRDFLYSRNKLRDFFERERPDKIFHLASYGNMVDQRDEWEIIQANIFVTYAMLTESFMIPYDAFVFVSSSSTTLPYETFYSATKGSGERIIKAFRNEYNKPVFIIRPYSVYGPGEADFRFIPTVCKRLITGETIFLDPIPCHDWIYVEDLVNTMTTIHEDADLGSGRSWSNLEIVAILEKISGKKAKITYTKNTRSFDTQNWTSDQCWTKTSIEEGLEKTYKYYYEKYRSDRN